MDGKTSQRIIIEYIEPQSPESLASTRFCLGVVLESFEDSLQVLGRMLDHFPYVPLDHD